MSRPSASANMPCISGDSVCSIGFPIIPKEGFIGYNTDMGGLWRAMHEEGISLKGEEVIILGAGGAGRAAVDIMIKIAVLKNCLRCLWRKTYAGAL